jgi:hypothetical protein
MILQNNNTLRLHLIFLWFLLIIPLVGCQIKLIADYDEKTDKAVTALHRGTETFLIQAQQNIGSPKWDYENKKDFYNKTKVDISVIEVRARALPKNEITIKQLNLLSKNFEALESLHKGGKLSIPVIENLRGSFNSAFTAILKLEMAKKRGND